MNEKRGYKPLRRTVSYMRRMINSGKWKANERIPTLDRIASSTKTSVSTVRKAIGILETERLLDNHGSFGYCVIPPDLTRMYLQNKETYYLRMLNNNIKALELLQEGAVPVGKFLVRKKNDALKVLNVVSGEKTETTFKELQDSMDFPITLHSLVEMTGMKLTVNRKKYFRQQKLRDIAKIVLKNKELL